MAGSRRKKRVDWIQAVTALTAAGALLFTGLSLRETQRQIEITERGQVTDRFNRAVAHFADQDELIKLGGIHELDSIARDSPRDRDAVAAMLSAFVRKRQSSVDQPCGYGPMATEPAAALTALAGLGAGKVTDLKYSCLNLLFLPGATFRCVQLQGAILRGAIMPDADLTRAYLSSANFSEPDLPAEHPEGAVLSRARLAGAQLRRASLTHARLDGADLSGADLSFAKLNNAKLTGANLRGADLSGADLTGADLSETNLAGAYVRDTVFADSGVSRESAVTGGAVDSRPPKRPADTC